MTTKVDSYGISKTYVNEKLVKGIQYDATYDGSELDLAVGDHEGNNVFINLDNDDIIEILEKFSSDESLEDRIKKDYGAKRHVAVIKPDIKEKKTKKRKRKTPKSKTKSKPKSKPKSKTKSKSKTKTNTYRKTKAIPSIQKTVF